MANSFLKEKLEYFLLPIPIILFIFTFIITLSSGLYNPRVEILPTKMLGNNILIISLIIGISPIAYYEWQDYKRKRNIQRTIPKFLDTLSENIRGGLNYVNALRKATESYKSDISDALKDAINKHYLGLEFREAIKLASKRINFADAEPFLNVLSRAYYAGEAAVEAIKNASSFYWAIEEYRNSRESETRVYLGVIFISLIVYLFVALLILTQLIIPVTTFSSKASFTGLKLSFFGNISPYFLASVFLWMGIIEALFAGMIIGKIIYNRIRTGLVYSIIMMVIVLISFNLFV
ncbi:MAG: type II secretion system F family protein [Thermoproteota archaeon]